MNDHLKIQVSGHFLPLPQDFSIEYEESNPIFNENPDSFSYPVKVKFDGARQWLKNMDYYQSDLRPVDLEHSHSRIYVEGLPFRSGDTKISDNAVLDSEFEFSIDSNSKTLSDYVSDLSCQDIPMGKDDSLLIGEKIGNVCVDYNVNYHYELYTSGKTGFMAWDSHEEKVSGYDPDHLAQSQIELQALGFSHPYAKGHSRININTPYPDAKFCNARVCYTHYKLDNDGKTSSTVDESVNGSTYAPYFVLDAERPASGICFYVLYFFDKLFEYLNLSYDNSNLTAVGDMNRLCFFTTQCHFDTERAYPNGVKPDNTFDYEVSYDNIGDLTKDAINAKLNEWEANENNKYGWKSVDNIKTGSIDVKIEDTKSLKSVSGYAIGDKLPNGQTLKRADYIVDSYSGSVKANLLYMYANSKNLPNQDISTVISSMWGSFGVRFVLDYETKQVTPVFIRDVFRDDRTPLEINGTILSINKVTEKITGVRMKYADEGDKKAQQSNITNGTRDYDTNYDYIDYSNINSLLTYKNIIKKNGVSDTTCYVDLTTGNRYRIKVNGDATEISDMNATLFEVASLHSCEWGDCSKENEDFVQEIESSFQPVIFTDVNGRKERDAYQTSETLTNGKDSAGNTLDDIVISGNNDKDAHQVLAAFIDEDMLNENEDIQINTAMGSDHVNFYVTENLHTNEKYDPSKTDDATSPLATYDWGLAIAVMRGAGSSASIEKYDYDYDGCGSYHWRMTAGESAVSCDSIDNWGAEYDYNGDLDGVDWSSPTDVKANERISLKIRAYIEDDNGTILCANDVYTYIDTATGNTLTATQYEALEDKSTVKRVITKKVRSRGLADSFMSEYAYFLLHRQKYIIKIICSAAQLCNVPNNWARRWRIGNVTGWIDRIKTAISCKKGIEVVEITMFSL